MGRRSQHTVEELRILILDAAQSLVEEGGIATLSARSVARDIGYAPGTLYNVYDNIDDIILRVEGRLLDSLDQHLAEVMAGASGARAVHRFASGYLRFAQRQPKLWCILQEHHLPSECTAPEWYLTKLHAPAERLETPLRDLMENSEIAAVRRTAYALWANIHGLSLLATSNKAGGAGTVTPQMLDEMVETYLMGLTGRSTKREKLNGANGKHPDLQP